MCDHDHDIVVKQYDALDFDIVIYNANGTTHTLASGEKLWLTVKKALGGTALINEQLTSLHYKADSITLNPGVYQLEIGLIFADDTTETAVQTQLIVEDRLRGESE